MTIEPEQLVKADQEALWACPCGEEFFRLQPALMCRKCRDYGLEDVDYVMHIPTGQKVLKETCWKIKGEMFR